jgi:hypothetical protein
MQVIGWSSCLLLCLLQRCSAVSGLYITAAVAATAARTTAAAAPAQYEVDGMTHLMAELPQAQSNLAVLSMQHTP